MMYQVLPPMVSFPSTQTCGSNVLMVAYPTTSYPVVSPQLSPQQFPVSPQQHPQQLGISSPIWTLNLPERSPASSAPVKVPQESLSRPFMGKIAGEQELPPPLIDSDTDGEEELVGQHQEEVCVALMSGVQVNADSRKLLQQVEDRFGSKIVRSLAVWNKGAILVQFAQHVLFTDSRVILDGHEEVQIVPSQKPEVCIATPSHTLNVRVFLLDPVRDYDGSAQQVKSFEKETEDWATSRMAALYPLKHLIERAGQELCKNVIPPRQARMVSAHSEKSCQRCYTQLLVKYENVETATRALSRMDGFRQFVRGFKVVVRAEHAKPFKR